MDERDFMLLSDPQTGKKLIIALWDYEQKAVTDEQSGCYMAQLVKFTDFFSLKNILT